MIEFFLYNQIFIKEIIILDELFFFYELENFNKEEDSIFMDKFYELCKNEKYKNLKIYIEKIYNNFTFCIESNENNFIYSVKIDYFKSKISFNNVIKLRDHILLQKKRWRK